MFLRRAIYLLTLLLLVIGTSIYLELLGHRILKPDLLISDVWSGPFVAGFLRTAAGSLFMGLLFVAVALIPGKLRSRTKSYWIVIWSAGATLFLVVMAALILWAP